MTAGDVCEISPMCVEVHGLITEWGLGGACSRGAANAAMEDTGRVCSCILKLHPTVVQDAVHNPLSDLLELCSTEE